MMMMKVVLYCEDTGSFEDTSPSVDRSRYETLLMRYGDGMKGEG